MFCCLSLWRCSLEVILCSFCGMACGSLAAGCQHFRGTCSLLPQGKEFLLSRLEMGVAGQSMSSLWAVITGKAHNVNHNPVRTSDRHFDYLPIHLHELRLFLLVFTVLAFLITSTVSTYSSPSPCYYFPFWSPFSFVFFCSKSLCSFPNSDKICSNKNKHGTPQAGPEPAHIRD
jgi:hypothetical protein